jgi:RNA polymerase sigma-32 factor
VTPVLAWLLLYLDPSMATLSHARSSGMLASVRTSSLPARSRSQSRAAGLSLVKPPPSGSRARTCLTPDEERRLARLARAGDERAFERLVEAHIPLVYTMAHEFRSFGSSFDDLIGEGLLGLVKAAREFDPDRGARLASYAAWWIRAYLRRFTIENRRIVRGPSTRNARKVLAGLSKTERALSQADGQKPDREAVATALGVTPRDVEDMKSVLGARDVPCGVEVDGRTFEVPCEAFSPETLLSEADERRALTELVQGALSHLEPRSRRILEGRYLAPETRSLADLGHELGISRERVRQLETAAKEQVRASLAS